MIEVAVSTYAGAVRHMLEGSIRLDYTVMAESPAAR